ncbi:stage VI sporulation protein F [Metabacillus litoralis]|uniref:stage VI sporulation protein F n=1 Tax=Metabacillus litoralis TaxID=152268 RepID=UPI001CFD0D88|nr:stage VI sporulation protein F [Metabacillus litoralis]
MDKKLLSKLEKKTGLTMSDVLQVVNSIEKSKIKDEEALRNIVSKLSAFSKGPVNEEMEESIVHTILNNKVPKELSKFLNKMNIGS